MTSEKRAWITSVLCLCLGLGVASCGDQEAESSSTESETTAAAEPEAAPTAEQVPVPEDFAEEAQSSIDEANYRDELAAIESELGE